MKPCLLLAALFFIVPVPALAADFSAAIGSDHVKSGESVSLQLTLSGANAGGAPDISALKQVFTVTSKLQPSNITIGTTAANTKVHWQLSIVPKRGGRLTIPAITIETDSGILRTAPVTLEVDQRSTPIPSQANIYGSTVSVTALAATTTPYQNQSILYTIRSELRGSVSDASLDEISVNNAIVAPEGQPEVRDAFENGSPVKIIEFHFIITPLQPGTLIIPPTVMQGKVRTPDITNMFGGGPSGKMGQAMNFFSAFGDAPFKVASNEVQLDVKPPATKMDPWLPLTSLRVLEDTTVSQSIQIGEPLVRKITLLADGAVGSQLPDLEARQDHKNFRVYADKPTTGENVDTKSGAILGWRKESYTLIPQKAGPLVLPAIKVRWWDVANNKAAIAELPERVINVLPVAAGQKLSPAGIHAAGRSAPMQSFKRPSVFSFFRSLLLYGLVSVLAGALLVAALWRVRLRHGIRRQETDKAPVFARKQPFRKLASRLFGENDLDHVRTAEELRNFLQTYLYARRGISKNTSLDKSLPALSKSWTEKQRDDVDAVIKGIGAALYAGKVIDMDDLKKRCRRIITALNRETKNNRKDRQRLGSLNPT
jgi:hypothetical protein